MNVQTQADYAVRFNQDPFMGLDGPKAFPFIYTFINRNDDTWSPVAASVQGSLSCIGPVIPANTTRVHPVILDSDYNFKILNIKYTCYKWVDDPNGIPGYYRWYTVISGTISEGMTPGMDLVGTPLYRYISMSLYFQGSGAEILYGGPNVSALSGVRFPIPIECMQGYEYGMYAIRTPRLLPRQGAMIFEITNTHPTYDIIVGAAITGMKIKV